MQLRVKPMRGEELEVDIDEGDTIETLKVLLMTLCPDLEDSEPEDIRLAFKGVQLKDGDQTIAGAGIGKSSDDFVVCLGKKKAAAKPAASPAPAAGQPAAPAAAPAGAPVGAAAAAGSVVGAPPEATVQGLIDMGFPREQVLQALRAAYNDADRAAAFLLEGNIPSAPEEAAPPQQAPPQPLPAAPQGAGGGWAQGLLGAQLLTKGGMQATEQALGGAPCVLLYFSAHWCPPCRGFTPRLAAAFNAPGVAGQAQVVFVSRDRDLPSYMGYYAEMPWTALPFGSPQTEMLMTMFGVRGIPTLVALDGRTGRVLEASAVQTVSRNNFDLASCCRSWGVAAPAVAPSQPAGGQALVAAATPEPAAPPKKPEPPPCAIDGAAARGALARVAEQEWAIQEAFYVTLLKVLNNTLQNPGEAKFRSLKKGNAALQGKLLGVGEGAAAQLLLLAGFQESDEVISLAEAPDGRCTAVRDEVQSHADEQKMRELRRERDAKIAEEVKKDQGSSARYGGGGDEKGRMNLGGDRKKRGGG